MTNQLSTREIRMLMKVQENARKKAREAQEAALKHAFGKVIQPAVDELTQGEKTDKPDSQWAGWSIRTIPVTLDDGTEVTVSMTVTDVARTTEKTDAAEAEALEFLNSPEGQALLAQQG